MQNYGLTRGSLANIEETFQREVKPILYVCTIRRSNTDDFALRVSDGVIVMGRVYLNEGLRQLMLDNALLLRQGSVIRVNDFYPIIMADPFTMTCKPGLLINDIEIVNQVQIYGDMADAA